MDNQPTINEVENFWSKHPCGSAQSKEKERKFYFEEIEKLRYSLIRHIPKVAKFTEFKNKKVLEVGCGIGTDGAQFARNGAIYTGINLDEGSTLLARECFEVFGLKGTILKMDAEKMDFPSNTFDHVYSLGVIHHSPNTGAIVDEIYRVLKPGGSAKIMIYNKSSINYYFEIMFLRKLFRYALYPSFAPKLIAKAVGLNEQKLNRHRDIFFSEKMTIDRWISINTDGPDCPLAKIYDRRQSIELFSKAGFKDIKTFVRFFDKSHYGYVGKLIPNKVADFIGNYFGWNRWVEAVKDI